MGARGLLGIAIVASVALAACGTASGQIAGVATTVTPTSTARSGAGQAASGSGQAAQGSSQAMPGAAAARPTPPAAAVLPATARPGDHGKGVAALQRQLAALGYEVRGWTASTDRRPSTRWWRSRR